MRDLFKTTIKFYDGYEYTYEKRYTSIKRAGAAARKIADAMDIKDHHDMWNSITTKRVTSVF